MLGTSDTLSELSLPTLNGTLGTLLKSINRSRTIFELLDGVNIFFEAAEPILAISLDEHTGKLSESLKILERETDLSKEQLSSIIASLRITLISISIHLARENINAFLRYCFPEIVFGRTEDFLIQRSHYSEVDPCPRTTNLRS